MPLFDKNQSIINKLESARKGGAATPQGNRFFAGRALPKPNTAIPTKKDASIFHGKSQASRANIKKELRGLNPKDYGLKIKKIQMAELEKLFPGRFNDAIDHDEAKAAAKELYWQIVHESRDAKNWKQVAIDKNKLKLLKDIGDIDERLYKM